MEERMNTCVSESFTIPGDFESDNKMLLDDAKWARLIGLNYHPAVTINDFTYRGDIDYADIQQAVCAAFNFRRD